MVFVAARELSLVAASGGYSSLRCMGFSLRWLLLLRSTGSRHTGSVVVARGLSSCGLWPLERRLSSCGTRAQLLHGMWDLPGLGLEPMSPASAGGFLTTAPPGKPHPTFNAMSSCNRKWGPAARRSKANKEARLVERRVCFVLDASNRDWGGGRTPVQRPKHPAPTTSGQELL